MSFVALIVFGIALSSLIAILIGVVRAVVCLVHSIKGKHVLFATVAGMEIVILITLFAAMIVVWFGYGVAHTGKDATTDIIVLASTVVPAYIAAYGVWRLSSYLDHRIVRDAI